MKKLLLNSAFIILLMSASFLSVAQQALYFGAGTTFVGPVHGDAKFQDRFGYFAGVTAEALLDGPFRYSANLQFVKQHVEILDIDLNIHAINASFYYGIEAVSDLTVLAGVQMGYMIDIKVGDLHLPDYNEQQFGWVTGLSYDILEKLRVEARYVRAMNEQLFDYTIQVGIHYKLQ